MKAKREELKNVYVQQGKMADPNHVYQLDEAVPFVAECMDMCPEYEREEREYTNFLEPFEKVLIYDWIIFAGRMDYSFVFH